VTDITTNNGHADFAIAKSHLPNLTYEQLHEQPKNTALFRTDPPRNEVAGIIESIQTAYDRQCRELDQKDNLIELLRDELARKNEQLESYMRKTYEIAQQMKAVAQLCDEGRRLADIVDRG
jgi:hypothetical protein